MKIVCSQIRHESRRRCARIGLAALQRRPCDRTIELEVLMNDIEMVPAGQHMDLGIVSMTP